MNAHDREQFERLEERVTDSVRSLSTKLETGLRDVRAIREKDREAAKADNERRHAEVLAAVKELAMYQKEMNGSVRRNTSRLDRIESAREVEERLDPRKAAFMGAGGATGAAGIIYAIVKVLEVVQ